MENMRDLRQKIISKIEKPMIGSGQVEAMPNSEIVQTSIIQEAIDSLSSSGGGVLRFPAGIYKTGALQLKSGVELRLLSPDTQIKFVSENLEQDYPVVYSHWEGTPCFNYSPLLYGFGGHDIAITGCGVLDGGADRDHWWNWHSTRQNVQNDFDLQDNDSIALRRMNSDGIPIEERQFGNNHYLRPNFIQLINCNRVMIQGVTLRNSPMWQINPVKCSSVTVDNVSLVSHGPNNDGCDPESCNGVWIKNCYFNTGDDCISLKSGRDRDGYTNKLPCEDVLIEHNEFADGHGGIALGSEMSGGIYRVYATANHFSSRNLTYALRFKSNAKRGGIIEKIVFRDSVIDSVQEAAIHGTMLYEDGRNGDRLPVFRDILIENIEAHGGEYGIFLEAFPEVPITGVQLRDIRIDGVSVPLRCINWKGAVVENVYINGKPYPCPEKVRILGIPKTGNQVRATAEVVGSKRNIEYKWEISTNGKTWEPAGTGAAFDLPRDVKQVRVTAMDGKDNQVQSMAYRVLDGNCASESVMRLYCRGILDDIGFSKSNHLILTSELTEMLLRIFQLSKQKYTYLEFDKKKFFATGEIWDSGKDPKFISRQEMAAIAMRVNGNGYRNSCNAVPDCADEDEVDFAYKTDVSRALYFGFLTLDSNGRFNPKQLVNREEALDVVNRLADFVGF